MSRNILTFAQHDPGSTTRTWRKGDPIGVLYFCESPCPSRWGLYIFVSPLASHVGVLHFREFSCLSSFGVLDFCESFCLSHRNDWLYGNVSFVWYSLKHGAAHREVSQLGHMLIVRSTFLRKDHKWHLRLLPCLGKWRPTNRVGGSLQGEMLEEGSSFNNDQTTCNRDEGNVVAPSTLILYSAWALDRQISIRWKKYFDTILLFVALFL